MKRFAKIAFVLIAAVTFVSAADLKIGYIDSDAVLAGYSGTKAAEEKLRQFYAKLEQEATEKQGRIKQMQDELHLLFTNSSFRRKWDSRVQPLRNSKNLCNRSLKKLILQSKSFLKKKTLILFLMQKQDYFLENQPMILPRSSLRLLIAVNNQ